jgi:aminomethyltransferase
MTMDDHYRALTTTAAAFSTEDLGQFEVSGPDAHAFVNRVTTVDVSKLPPGRFAHALILRDDATVMGRVTVYRFEDLVMLLVQGRFRAEAWEYIVDRKRGNVRLRDISESVAAIAVRGPMAVQKLATLLEPVPQRAGDLCRSRLAGVGVFAARATDDGPDGVDLYCRSSDLESLRATIGKLVIPFVDKATWELVRLEWGVARIGVEIDPDDTPIEASLDHLVAQGKGAPFPGELALDTRRRSGPLKRLVGFAVAGDDVPPVGAEVFVNDRAVDRVRSVAASPRAGVIGMTAVPQGADAAGTPLVIVAGESRWEARVIRPPFVPRDSAG